MENNKSTEIEQVTPIQTVNEPVISSSPHSLQISILLASIIIGVSLVGATYLYTASLKTKEPTNLTPEEESYTWQNMPEIPTPPMTDPSSESYYDYGNDKSEFLKKAEEENVVKYSLEVNWLPRPVKTSFMEIPYDIENWFSRIYIVGTITNGALAGTSLYLIYSEGMGEDYAQLYAVNNQTVTLVSDWVSDVSGLPNNIIDDESKLKLIKGEHILGTALIDLEGMSNYTGFPITRVNVNSSIDIPDEELYQYQQCFFARTPSDLLVEYTVDLPFIEDENEGGYNTPTISFTRIDGTKVTGEYEVYDRVNYGCGSLCSPLKVVTRPDSDFVKTGSTDGGFELFVLKDSYDSMLTELYNQPNTRAFVTTTNGQYESLKKNKYSYEQFLSMAPILFWKDQLGRWVHFIHSEFLILAEKCKPVIYLYPEKETDLHVEVKPNVGFTKTIPQYKDGWDVTAYPDGTIIEQSSKEKFDYLYWTGWVDGYPLIEKGWVVKQKDLPAFFDVYLPKLGLIGKEIEDFKEYWEEDMKEAPYYAVAFVDQAVIDELSPLTLDVTPDKVIRVLMTAMPLDRPIKLDTPYLPETPVRHGFTVVEWGGTILRSE